MVNTPKPFDLGNERHVDVYDELPLWSALAGQLLLDHVPLRAGSVLDLGCGTGFPLLELAERLGRGATVIGLDPWHEGLRRVHRKREAWSVTGVEVVRGDGAAMPFRESWFDLVVSNLGVNNFDDVTAALAECRRVAKPGGTLALTSNLQGHMRELYAAFEDALAGDDPALARLRRHVEHRATVESLSARLEAAGFHVAVVREREVTMRFANATALFEHHFIRLGFRPAWENVAGSLERLARLRAELDRVADAAGALRLSVPLAYIEARRD